MDSGSTARRLPALNHAAFKRYFDDLLADIRGPFPSRGDDLSADQPEDIAESIFRTISGRRYCYLSRKRSAIYRDSAVRAFAKHICKPALVTTENYECVRLFELDLRLEISGRPAPVFVGVREWSRTCQ